MSSFISRRKFVGASAIMSGALYSLTAGPVALSWGASSRMAPGIEGEVQEDIEEVPVSAYRKRVSNIQAELVKRDLGALVIISTGPPEWESRYLARDSPGIVLVPAGGEPTCIFADSVPPRPPLISTWITDIRGGLGWERMLDRCLDRLKELNLARGRIALGGDMLWAVRPRFRAALPEARFEDGNEIQDRLRLIKDEYEIRFMKRAGEIASAEIRIAQQVVRPDRRVYEVLAETQRVACSMGAAQTMRFWASRDLVGWSSEGSNQFLAGSHSHRLSEGEAFVFEPIPYYGHYNVETPVTFALGRVSAAQKEIAELDFDAWQAGVEKLKPGVPVLEAVRAAHSVINPKGYPEFTNGPGHFIGIANIERPPIEREPSVVLQAGMTVSFHGTLAVSGKGKHWVGCCFLITDKGKEALTDIRLEPLIQV